jgi:hypothetical protein
LTDSPTLRDYTFTFGYGVWINGTTDTARDITITDSSFNGALNRFQSIAFDGQVGGPQINISDNTFGAIGPNGLGAIRVEDFANTFNTPFDYSGIGPNTFVNAPDASSGGVSYYGLIRNGSGEVVKIGEANYNNGSGPDYDQVITALSTASGQTLTGGSLADIVVGSDSTASGDTISGGGGNDFIVALAGDDTIDAGGGSDQLFGDAGNDTLNGGVNDFAFTPAAANDVLWGGADTDTFRFEGRFGDDSIGASGTPDWTDGEDMVFVGYGSQTPTFTDDGFGNVIITIDDGSVASSVTVYGASAAQMQPLVSGLDLIIH